MGKIPLETALKRFVQRTGIDSRTLFRHGFSDPFPSWRLCHGWSSNLFGRDKRKIKESARNRFSWTNRVTPSNSPSQPILFRVFNLPKQNLAGKEKAKEGYDEIWHSAHSLVILLCPKFHHILLSITSKKPRYKKSMRFQVARKVG